MPDFESIIKDHATRRYFAGKTGTNKDIPGNQTDDEKKRISLITALSIRKKECNFRFKIAIIILFVALLTLIYLSLFQPKDLATFKDLLSVLGGGSIIALVYYIISLRDELTKIKQTEIIANAVDSTTLNTMLLTLSSR